MAGADNGADGVPSQRRRHQRAQAEDEDDPRTGRSGKLQQIECGKASPQSRPEAFLAKTTFDETDSNREKHNQAEDECHPKAVGARAEWSGHSESVRGGSERETRRTRP